MCRANQWIGFYMITASVKEELNFQILKIPIEWNKNKTKQNKETTEKQTNKEQQQQQQDTKRKKEKDIALIQ